MALKQLPKTSTSLRSFLYEFCVGLSLGTHPAIVAAYGIGIESADSYSFLTEPILHGDLIAFIQPKVGSGRAWRPRSHGHCIRPSEVMASLGSQDPGLVRPFRAH